MGLVRTIALGGLLQRPARTLFSVLGIALGIATVVGVFTLDHNTVVGLSVRGASDWKPGIEVRPAPEVTDPSGELDKTPGVLSHSPIFQNEIVVRKARDTSSATGRSLPPAVEAPGSRTAANSAALPADVTVRARLFGLDSAALERIDVLRVLEGRILEASAREREILLGEPLAAELDAHIGDRVLLARPARQPRQECVDGVLAPVADPIAERDVPVEESFTVVGLLAREKVGRRSQGEVVVVDARWARELYKGTRIEPVFWVRQDPNVDIERLRSSLGASFSYELNRSVLVGAAADERAFRNGVRMAGLFALVLGLYVIFHTLSISIRERVREVATLHALGATRKQIVRVFFFESVVLTTCAAALGLAGGLALARFLLVAGVTTLGAGHPILSFDVPWGSIIGLVLLGVGIALLGSVYPLMRARHVSTTAALRGDEAIPASGVVRGFHLFSALLLAGLLPGIYFVIVPVVGEAQKELVGAVLAAVGFLALLVTLPLVVPALLGRLCATLAAPLTRLWPFSGRMAANAMRSSPARIAFSAAAIALVAAAFVGLKGMTASLRGEIEVWSQRAIADKVYLRGLPNARFEDLRRELAQYPGFVALENGSARSYVPFLLLGMRTRELRGYGPCAADPALLKRLDAGDAVILSERLARHLEYAVGDKVHVSNASGRVQDLEVIAISDSYGYFPHPDERLYGVTSDHFMQRAYCLDVDTLNDCAVVLEPGTDPETVRAAVQKLWPSLRSVGFETGAALAHEHVIDLERDFRLFDLILGLSAILALLGVLNGQLLAALERSKELGVLRALGTTRRQLSGMVLCEAAVIGVFGGVLGTVLGAALVPVIVRALEALSGLDLPLEQGGPWLWMVPLGAVVLTLAAAAYPILRMNRSNPTAAVRAP